MINSIWEWEEGPKNIISVLETNLWEDINSFAERMIAESNRNSDIVIWCFNGVKLVVDAKKWSTVSTVVWYFKSTSIEGIIWKMEAEEEKQIKSLNILDFSDYKLVLEWLLDFQKVTEHIGGYFKYRVISIFESHGFYINVNAGKDFDWEDFENFTKYLIGQVLDSIQKWSNDQIIHKFVDDWRKKFVPKVETESTIIIEKKAVI